MVNKLEYMLSTKDSWRIPGQEFRSPGVIIAVSRDPRPSLGLRRHKPDLTVTALLESGRNELSFAG